MKQVEFNDQWKLDGDCSLCRRRSYCSKVCTRNRNKTRAEIKNLVGKIMVQRVLGGKSFYDENSSL